MRRFVASLVTGALASALFVAGAPGAGAGEQCDLLRKKEVEKAIDRKVKVGPPATGLGGECSFTVRGEPLDTVNLWLLEGDDAKTGYEVGEDIAGDDAEEIDGLGDKAVYTGDPFNTLYVLDGDNLVYLQYYLFTGEESEDDVRRAVVQMTKKVLKRI
jgi:hypothetical protein